MALALFSYRKGNTVLHRIPALLKIALLFAFSFLAFSGSGQDSLSFFENTASVVKLFSSILCASLLFVLGGCYWKAFFKMKFIFVLGLFIIAVRTISFETGRFALNMDGFAAGLLYALRFFLSAFAAEVIYETTSGLEINQALELVEDIISKIIPPFKKLKSAFVISMAINFIPLVFDTWEKIHLASKARGSEKKGIGSTFRTLYCETEALFDCLLFRAETRRKAVINRSL